MTNNKSQNAEKQSRERDILCPTVCTTPTSLPALNCRMKSSVAVMKTDLFFNSGPLFPLAVVKTDHYSSPSPDKPTLIPASHFRENSPPPSTADQWDPQSYSNRHHQEINGPSPALPKLMFAEWLSLDSFAATSAAPLVGCSNTKGFAGGTADFGPDISGLFGGDDNNGLFHGYPLFQQGTSGGQNSMTTTVSDGSANDVFSSQFSFDDQSSVADANNYQFVEFCSEL
ncbi:unnamed protein product [Linum trigynum]|uniref:Uncharacterized protein n=2 Tax=Linum trigynum TaxID=586398 RepID=A0AAV2G701_9ROSI